MGLNKFLQNLKNSQEGIVRRDGSETTDTTLLSLRRQQRLMNEREEKQRLRNELRSRAMANDRDTFKSNSVRESRTILSKLPSDKSKKFMTARSNLFS